MKQFFLGFILSIVIFLLHITVSAQVTGGQISFSSSSLSTSEQTCLKACQTGGAGCYSWAYNRTYPTGGSGRYMYSWESKLGNGSWVPMTTGPTADLWYYTNLPQPPAINTRLYFRRKVKDSLNLNYSAYSNEITLASYTYYHGYNQFSDGSIQNIVSTGTSPLSIKNSGSTTDNYGDSYIFWEKKVGVNGQWGIENYYQITPMGGSIYSNQPPARNTPDTVYYRSYLENSCGDYDTTYSNIVTVIFVNPITFSAGVISTPNYNVCSGTVVPLKSTTTTAPSPYTSIWEYSSDSTNWVFLASGDTAVDKNFLNTRYYRRVVTAQNSTYFSNIIKVNVAKAGDPAVFGSNAWKFYNYNGTNITTLSNNIYRGYYTSDSLNINTISHWADTSSPSSVVGYQGCIVNKDNFTTVGKRMGFDTGTYQINVGYKQGTIKILKNDSIAYTLNCCNNNQALNIGKLGPTTKLEIRFTSGVGASSFNVEFIRIGPRPSSFVNADCNSYRLDQSKSRSFVDIIDSIGAPVAAINNNLQNFPFIVCRMQHNPPGSGNIAVDTNGIHFMPRYFNFESAYGTQNFALPITVRLYFLNSEFDDYKVAANKPSINLSDLRVLHYDGVNEDCQISNNSSYGNVLTPIAYDTFGTDGFYLDIEASHFSEFGVTSEVSTLPVSFIDVSAAKSARGIEIDWKVAESPKDGTFDILRSTDGVSFTKIAGIESKYSAEPIKYSFTDLNTKGINNYVYYRIRQKDQNGKLSFSKIVSVKMANQPITIHPNPVHNSTTIKSITAIKQIIITDVAGKIIKTLNANSNTVTINLSSIPSGIYLVNTKLASGESEIRRIIKE